jgi:hypothetical protein
MDKWEGLHKHCNEFGAFQKGGEFIDELSYYQFLKKDFCFIGLVTTFELCTSPLILEQLIISAFSWHSLLWADVQSSCM